MKCLSAILAGLSLLALAACAKAPPPDPVDTEVDALVDNLTHGSTEGQAMVQLEAGGQHFVPYIVGHLGDDRDLADSHITLENHAADAFEATRHYSPAVVEGALSALLTQITGQHFGDVVNGATPAEREKDRQGWVSWCKKAYPDKGNVCEGND
jgi:hypothetical protein